MSICKACFPAPGKLIETTDSGYCIVCDAPVLSKAFSKIEGLRHNTGKPRLDLNSLGREVQIGEAAVWEKGLVKYSLGNWLKGMSWQESAASLRRHYDAFLNGENCDPESGLPHVDHMICCAKIMSNSYHNRKDLDDRVLTKGTTKAERIS